MIAQLTPGEVEAICTTILFSVGMICLAAYHVIKLRQKK